MIIPIGHDRAIYRRPWVTFAIIAACTAVQVYATFGAPSLDDARRLLEQVMASHDAQSAEAVSERAAEIVHRIPALEYGYITGAGSNGWTTRLVTSAFVHEGWFHLIGNMLFLYLAGPVLEDRWGKLRFLAFYLAGAVVANLAFAAMAGSNPHLLIGASGAISATMGAFLVYYGRHQITLWYWLMWRTGTFQMTAYLALPLWLGMQVLWALLDRETGGVSGTAYAAHIGGFVFGMVVAIVLTMIFGKRAHSEEESTDPVEAPAAPVLPEARVVAGGAAPAIPRPARFAAATAAPPNERPRLDRCMEAIEGRDVEVVRTLASRVIFDFARTGDHARILEVYEAMDVKLPTVPLTDGAFAATALAADTLEKPDLYIAIARTFLRAHPLSGQLPKVLFRAAQLDNEAGRVDAAVETLQYLAQKFAYDPYGIQAQKALENRG